MDLQERLHGVRCSALDPIDDAILARQELDDELAETGPIADELETTTEAYDELLSACDDVRDAAKKAREALDRLSKSLPKPTDNAPDVVAEGESDALLIRHLIKLASELEGG